MSANIAIVKSAVSGDSVVLLSTMTPPPGEPPLEKTLSFAFVSAPRLKREGDEPYAFQSREHLRKLIVGKEVQFGVLHTVPSGSSQRDYGLITLPTGESVIEQMVSEGLVKVREEAGGRDEGEDIEILIEKLKILQNQAMLEGKGRWSTVDDGRIETGDGPLADPAAFLEQWKGKRVEAVIERIISGDRVAVRLLLEPKSHRQVVVLIAGIRCPRSDGNEAGEEFGEEAKSFSEFRLLQRTVHVELLDLTPQNQLIGIISHAKGNIAEHLLLEGLARCNDFHSTILGARMARLRAAEQRAKDERLKMWKGHVVKKLDNTNSFDAVVSRIIWADQLIIRNKAGQEKKVSLSSVRGPKNTDPKQSPWQAEAKEFLRRKIIGKHVRVAIDGKRPASEGYEEREMATVMFGDKNIALGLVEAGLASVIRHRRDDEDRSPIYDELLAADEQAQASSVGMYSNKAPATAKITEASESLQKAKTYLSFLQRQKRIPAVVDYCAAGSRFKVIIPRENARITFILGGIRAPKTARNANETSEPFGQEALDFVSKKVMQRDVEIDVENIDRVGGFIGTMFIGRENVAKLLVVEGLASVHAYSAGQSPHGSDLFAAEKLAQDAKKGMWHNYDPSQEASQEASLDTLTISTPPNGASTTPQEKRKDYKDVLVTHVDPETCALKLHVLTGDLGPSPLESFMAEFRTYHASSANAIPLQNLPRNGEYVAAKFTEDNTFYRARVRAVDREAKTCEVVYIDYGNSERIPLTRLRALAPQHHPTTGKLKAQAQDAVFSFVEFSKNKEYLGDAVHFVQDMTGGDRPLVANVDWIDEKEGGVWYVTLYDPKESKSAEASLNADIVREGMAIAGRKERGFEKAWPEVIKTVREKEDEAKKERLGMWEYGGEY
ncbi:hypothetical protein L211DRAFT_785307 [Terfezia boudieri ATCC MYA-4762]|uniref:Probable endonuclease LCL3 n=1 Tax=Terfezia boudieri ATCC MYA-4762 TaxID=1051890 RepID=A0A3N4LRL3_9PEZI|nr:hypothetical protein L211DRAFT_785307 [Terfezia boudieri ATCC MYA-4762]